MIIEAQPRKRDSSLGKRQGLVKHIGIVKSNVPIKCCAWAPSIDT